jgi:hypothetical protein
MGYIIKKRHKAIGIDTTGASPTYIASPSRNFAKEGATLPRTMPIPIHKKTHKVRYPSNIDSFLCIVFLLTEIDN